MVTKAAV
jgi:hypothetical protein